MASETSLPLTTNPRYGKLFGMRHKAAIGVSEVSDAIVVVVSEETHQISVAFAGNFDSNIPKGEFRERLAEYLRK
jgi:diadenylate cyclase